MRMFYRYIMDDKQRFPNWIKHTTVSIALALHRATLAIMEWFSLWATMLSHPFQGGIPASLFGPHPINMKNITMCSVQVPTLHSDGNTKDDTAVLVMRKALSATERNPKCNKSRWRAPKSVWFPLKRGTKYSGCVAARLPSLTVTCFTNSTGAFNSTDDMPQSD